MRASRALGTVSLLLLIAGVATLALPALSASSIKVVQEGPSQTVGSTVIINMQASNTGFLPLNQLQINISIISTAGTVIASGSSARVNVQPGSTQTIQITLTPTVSLQQLASATNYTVQVSSYMDIGGVFPIHLVEVSPS